MASGSDMPDTVSTSTRYKKPSMSSVPSMDRKASFARHTLVLQR